MIYLGRFFGAVFGLQTAEVQTREGFVATGRKSPSCLTTRMMGSPQVGDSEQPLMDSNP